jgi:hypothetical protein
MVTYGGGREEEGRRKDKPKEFLHGSFKCGVCVFVVGHY